MTNAELNSILTQLMSRVALNSILDTMADIAATNAHNCELLDTEMVKAWDKASGKLVVLAVLTTI